MKDTIINFMESDGEIMNNYYTKSVKKTEQQKFLETILDNTPLWKEPLKSLMLVADRGL
jgi:hypothetical protein